MSDPPRMLTGPRMLKNGGPDFDETRATITSAPLSSDQKNNLLQLIAEVEAEKDQD